MKYLDKDGLLYLWGKIKAKIPTKTSDLTNDSGFISTETDPVFTSSPASEITASDIDRWDLKSDFSGYYTDLESLPKINNVTLTGNKTTSDLGIYYEDLTDKPTFDASFVHDAVGSTITNLQYYNLSMAGPDDYAKVIKILGYTASFEYDTNGIILSVLRDGYVERYNISKTADNHTVTKTIVNLATDSDLATKQDALVSGTSIKTINNASLLGSGNISTNQITNTYSTSTTNGYSCNYINNKYEPVVLYNNDRGSRDTITLSKSVNNFEYIEIFYGKTRPESSVRFTRGQTEYAVMFSYTPLTNGPQIVVKKVQVTGTSISHAHGYYLNFTASGVSTGSTNEIYIFRVLGWK